MSIKSLFLEVNQSSFTHIGLKVLAFSLASIALIWIINLIFQNARNKSSYNAELVIRYRFLYSLIVFMVIFSGYFALLVWYNGTEKFNFGEAGFYLIISNLILAFVTVIILFFTKNKELNKLINS